MEKINFTKASISNIPVKKSRYILGDIKCPGLFVRVSPSGHKVFIVYKKLHNKPIRVTLGNTIDLTVEQARKKAQKKISQISYEETNPNEQKLIDKNSKLTLHEIFKEYLHSISLAKNTVDGYKLCINRDLEDWKSKPLSKITGDMVVKRHKKLSSNSETSANKVMRVLRAVSNFARNEYEDAEGKSLFPDNPTRKLSRRWNSERRRKTHIPLGRLVDWFTATNELPSILKSGDADLARDYLQFLLFNGLRRREATKLEWNDVDLKGKRYIVRDPKNHDDLWMPLSDYSLEILRRRKKTGSSKPFEIDDPRKSIAKIRKASDIYFTIHDLRRTFMTIAESMDIGLLTIKTLVNHRSGTSDVTEGYIQINTERLRDPMQKISEHIIAAARLEPEELSLIQPLKAGNISD